MIHTWSHSVTFYEMLTYTLAPDVTLCMTYKGQVEHGLGMGTNDLYSAL